MSRRFRICMAKRGREQCPAGRLFQYQVRSGRVFDKIPGSRSGSGRVGVSKNTIGYFRVSFLLSGISGYVGYFWVYPYILGLFSMRAEKIAKIAIYCPQGSGTLRQQLLMMH